MALEFFKYHGAGNDFIIFDNRNQKFNLNQEQISFLCHRQFGIGADGIMLLNKSKKYDFSMHYYNSDGAEGTMCGNGGRCIVAFAKMLNLIVDITEFEAIDGVHIAEIFDDSTIKLKMNDVNNVTEINGDFILDTGSPHFVRFIEDVEKLEVFSLGREIRNRKEFLPKGINVNFVEKIDESKIYVRTYERGVENETLSCGTGVTAASLAMSVLNGNTEFEIKTNGGTLKTSFVKGKNGFENIWLQGPAQFVFKGIIEV